MNKLVEYYDQNGDVQSIEVDLHNDGLYFRPGTSDKEMIRDVRKDYSTLVFDDKVVMDCGANIGAFTVRALDEGAQRVVAYEPEKSNFEMVKLNVVDLNEYDNFELVNAAVSNSFFPELSFYINKSQKAMCSGALNPRVKSKRVQLTVDNLNFWDELERVQPSLVKMDIEGGEHEIFEGNFEIPDYVKEIAIEIHQAAKMEALYDRLLEEFPKVIQKEYIVVFGQKAMIVAHLAREGYDVC